MNPADFSSQKNLHTQILGFAVGAYASFLFTENKMKRTERK